MSIESPKKYSEEEIEKIEEMRLRVMKLRDGKYDLANEEKKYREKLAKDGIRKEMIHKIADRDSTKELEKLELKRESYRDGLTGLWNRKALKEQIPPIIDGIERKNGNYSLIMIDADDFKSVNDTYGHQIGDEVLCELAESIKSRVRKSDHVFRYGGEEFVVFLPDTDSHGAFTFAEKIRNYIEQMNLGTNKEQGMIMGNTVSIGIFDGKSLNDFDSEVDGSSSEIILDELIKGADRAMYLAKKNGKNNTVDYASNKEKADKLAGEKR